MLATLYDVEIPTINEHIAKIFSDHELEPEATIRNADMNLSGLTFGIYPLSAAGTPFGLAVGSEDNAV